MIKDPVWIVFVIVEENGIKRNNLWGTYSSWERAEHEIVRLRACALREAFSIRQVPDAD